MQQKKLLIVDDIPANIKVLWEILSEDYIISVTTSGSEALEIAASQNPPHLILLDVMMPELNGYDVCRWLKQNKKTRDIPVIFITAKTDEEDETTGISLGAVDFIRKPFNPDIVKARVKSHLQIKEHHDRLEMEVWERTEALFQANEALRQDIIERKKAEDLLKKVKDDEIELLELSTALLSELNLNKVLVKIMDTTKRLLSAQRCTLFLYDRDNHELWSQVAHGMNSKQIKIPADSGIAGIVFTTGQTVNIENAYADKRFNPRVDRLTGYKTRSILCMPVKKKDGTIIGVTQVLNKKGGPFTERDEKRLGAFSAQASIALTNARMVDDLINMKNYTESILESMSNGVISVDEKGKIIKYNQAAIRILQTDLQQWVGKPFDICFSDVNAWIGEYIRQVMADKSRDIVADGDLVSKDGKVLQIRLKIVPMIGANNLFKGLLMIMEDVTC